MGGNSRIYETISAIEIEQIVQNRFGRDAVIVSYRELAGGLFNTTYFIEISNPEKRLVLRIAPVRQELLFNFEKSMMAVETKLYDMFHQQDIPAPTVLLYDDSKAILPRNYQITEYIDSIPLHDPTFPGEYRAKILYDLGVYTAKMHQIKADKFGWPNPDGTVSGHARWADFILEFTREISDKSSQYGVFDEKDIQAFDDFFRGSTGLFDIKEQPSLVHTDLWDANVLVRKAEDTWEIAAVIDADRAIFADREYDLATPWLVGEDFMRGYGKPLDMTREGCLKRESYLLLGNFFAAYVYKVQYDDIPSYEACKEAALNSLKRVNCVAE